MEIPFQALKNNLFCGVPLDEDTLQMEWAGFDSGSGCLDRLQDDIWMPMRGLRLDPQELKDRRAFARGPLKDGPGGMDHLNRGLRKHTRGTTAMDLMPSSQLKWGGGVLRCCTLEIKENPERGTHALFSSVAPLWHEEEVPLLLDGGLQAYFSGIIGVTLELRYGSLPLE